MVRNLCAALTLSMAALANAQELEIKGLRIGMPEAEIIAKHGSIKLDDMTIAGAIPLKAPRVRLRDGKLDELVYYFDPEDFADVVAAVKGKFPKTKCRSSSYTTGVGNQLTGMSCRIDVRDGTLLLTQYAGRIDTSTLHMLSRELGKEISEWAKKQKSDI